MSKRPQDNRSDDKAIDELMAAHERATREASDVEDDEELPNPDKFSGPIGMDDEGNLFPPPEPEAEQMGGDRSEDPSARRRGTDDLESGEH